MGDKQYCRNGMLVPLTLCIFVVMFTSCNPNKGIRGFSDGVDKSKSLGVFVAEYVPLSNPPVFSNGTSLRFEEIWMERLWSISGSIFETVGKVRGDRFCMYIKISQAQFDSLELDFGKLDHDWRFKSDKGDYFTRSWTLQPALFLYGAYDDTTSQECSFSIVERDRALAPSNSPNDFQARATFSFRRLP